MLFYATLKHQPFLNFGDTLYNEKENKVGVFVEYRGEFVVILWEGDKETTVYMMNEAILGDILIRQSSAFSVGVLS